jgi:hypothetical protein
MSESMLSTEPGTSEESTATESTEVQSTFSWSEGVNGEGDAPDWYKGDKYKSVADQAKAYTDLEKRFGGFTGAPAAYELPEGLDGEDTFVKTLSELGAKGQMSQEMHGELLALGNSIFEAKAEFDTEKEMEALGPNADDRLKNVDGYMKNNLGDKYEEFKDVINNAKTVELVEALISSTSAAQLPTDSTPVNSMPTQGDVEKLMTEKDDNGKTLYHYSKSRQQEVEEAISRMHGH